MWLYRCGGGAPGRSSLGSHGSSGYTGHLQQVRGVALGVGAGLLGGAALGAMGAVAVQDDAATYQC